MKTPLKLTLSVTLIAAVGPLTDAQISDLQPGSNFPTAVAAFGMGRTADLDAGDVDLDGDLDMVAANGNDGGPTLNTLYINTGGIQGGVVGNFVDETAARFPGAVADTSRDVDFADVDGDCDLDLIIANRGTISNGGEPSRSYRNQGGQQLGNVGVFLEDSDSFWGTLVSVPVGQQVLGGGQGPFRDYSCDCEFADMNLDGALDLFHSSYGPNIGGTMDSRVFLNDGSGRFDELWPWADPAADIKLHTMEVDLVDLDGDFDLDVFAASRSSQARVYRNDLDLNTGTWPGSPFTDVTQTALIATGATLTGSNNYGAEPGDLDGDGDFDIWAVSYNQFSDEILRNNGDLTFTIMPDWVKGDPAVDEEQADLLDYDNDGDLDVFVPNFSGVNALYQNSLADGVPLSTGLLHRTGTASGGSLAPWPEVPLINNSGTTLEGDCVDLDNDGDADCTLANSNNQQNYWWPNTLGVPDTHAPSVHLLTAQGDKSDGSDTPIRVQLRDNASMIEAAMATVRLVFSVGGGPDTSVPMAGQGSMQFQTTLSGGINGLISYRVEGHDRNGNTFVSATHSYLQAASGVVPILPLGTGTQGVKGTPTLQVMGALSPGCEVDLFVCNAASSAVCGLLFSIASTPKPFKGGTLYTVPLFTRVLDITNSGGQLWVDGSWPASLPTGFTFWVQGAVADLAAAEGVALTAPVRACDNDNIKS